MSAVSAISRSPWLDKLARLGFLARAALYITIGAVAVSAALRLGGTPRGSRGAMVTLLEAPLGRILLVIIAIGLFGHAVWRFVEAALDPERQGTDTRGIAKRIGFAGTGLVYAALGVSAVKLLLGHFTSDDRDTQHWTARALATTGGATALWIVACTIVGYGLVQLYRAWRAKLDEQLSLAELSRRAMRWVIGVSRFGIAARGVVFIALGGLLARAARHHNPAEAGGLAKSLRQLVELGRIPFLLIALGLVAYGAFQMIEARFRRIAVS